jgi:hypothetical protein
MYKLSKATAFKTSPCGSHFDAPWFGDAFFVHLLVFICAPFGDILISQCD